MEESLKAGREVDSRDALHGQGVSLHLESGCQQRAADGVVFVPRLLGRSQIPERSDDP